MQHLIKNAKVMGGVPILSPTVYTGRTKRTSIQMTVDSITGQESDARALIQVSNDGAQWFNLGVIETTGTGPQKDGGPYEALWEYTRLKLESTPVNGDGRVNIYVTTRESR